METDGAAKRKQRGLEMLEEVSDLLCRVIQGDHYIKPYGIIQKPYLG